MAVRTHRQSTYGVDVIGENCQQRVGDQEDPVGAACGLLDVDEPGAAPPGLQDEVAAAHGVFEEVVAERLMLHTRSLIRTTVHHETQTTSAMSPSKPPGKG
jgi:hypothetical protein